MAYGATRTRRDARAASRRAAGAAVLSADRSRFLAPGDDEIGWTARRGRVPLGYLGDRKKTEETFPIIDGERVAVPGDRARLDAGRHHRAARARLAGREQRRREDLRRGGRGGAAPAPRRRRRARRRAAERALRRGGRRHRAAPPGRDARSGELREFVARVDRALQGAARDRLLRRASAAMRAASPTTRGRAPSPRSGRVRRDADEPARERCSTRVVEPTLAQGSGTSKCVLAQLEGLLRCRARRASSRS